MEKEGYVEAADAKVYTPSIRKSSRLQNKKNSTSCSKYVFKSYNSNSNTMKSSKTKIKEKRHQFPHRKGINGVFTAHTASMKYSKVVPSFEYRVQAKDGIRLLVDLNLKRSDWLKSLEKSVCVCENYSKPAFGSFRKEVEYLRDKNNFKFSSPDKTSASDARANSYVQNNFLIKSMSTEIGETLPSVVENEVITLSGSNQCWSKVDQKSVIVYESLTNSDVVQLSDFSSQHKGSLCSTTGKICSENLLNNTNEVNQEAGCNHSQSTVKTEEGINSAERMEVSRREDNAFVISASDDGHKRKKNFYKIDHIHGLSHERILRSTHIFGGKTIERDGVIVWRSSRLHSK